MDTSGYNTSSIKEGSSISLSAKPESMFGVVVLGISKSIHEGIKYKVHRWNIENLERQILILA